MLVTTYGRDGRPVSTPVSLAVDGDHADLRSFETAGKTRPMHHHPRVEVAPSTAPGRPTGPAIGATARRLEGAESRRAARLLAGKHPLLHGVLVPLTHRLGRAKTGTTAHFQLTPLAPGQVRRPPTDTLMNPHGTFAGGTHAHRKGPLESVRFQAAIR